MESLPTIVPRIEARNESVTFKLGPRGETQVVRTVIDPLIPVPLEGANA